MDKESFQHQSIDNVVETLVSPRKKRRAVTRDTVDGRGVGSSREGDEAEGVLSPNS